MSQIAIPKLTYGPGYTLTWTPDVPVSSDSYSLPRPRRIRVEADSGAAQIVQFGGTPKRIREVGFAWLPLSKTLVEFEDTPGESFEAFYTSAHVADFRYYPDRDAPEFMRASLVAPLTEDDWRPDRHSPGVSLYSWQLVMAEFVVPS